MRWLLVVGLAACTVSESIEMPVASGPDAGEMTLGDGCARIARGVCVDYGERCGKTDDAEGCEKIYNAACCACPGLCEGPAFYGEDELAPCLAAIAARQCGLGVIGIPACEFLRLAPEPPSCTVGL